MYRSFVRRMIWKTTVWRRIKDTWWLYNSAQTEFWEWKSNNWFSGLCDTAAAEKIKELRKMKLQDPRQENMYVSESVR